MYTLTVTNNGKVIDHCFCPTSQAATIMLRLYSKRYSVEPRLDHYNCTKVSVSRLHTAAQKREDAVRALQVALCIFFACAGILSLVLNHI